MGAEEIVLLNPAGAAIGTAPKASSHHRDTPYHLAFSCYVVDTAGRVLITRRALDKATFPGVWTNSCCGHPAPGEGLREAIVRRLDTELGMSVGPLTLVLPEFDYRATAADGVVEFERCPVVLARTNGDTSVRPNPAEVAAAGWRTWQECLALVDDPDASPWYKLQIAQLGPMGAPEDWPAAELSRLPPALSW